MDSLLFTEPGQMLANVFSESTKNKLAEKIKDLIVGYELLYQHRVDYRLALTGDSLFQVIGEATIIRWVRREHTLEWISDGGYSGAEAGRRVRRSGYFPHASDIEIAADEDRKKTWIASELRSPSQLEEFVLVCDDSKNLNDFYSLEYIFSHS